MSALVLALALSAGFATPVAHAAEAPQVNLTSGGGVGLVYEFDVRADAAVKFVYSFSQDSGESLDQEITADAEGRATIRWTPRVAGVQHLYAKSVDGAGELSVRTQYRIDVLFGGGPAAHWTLDYTNADTNGQNLLTANGHMNQHALGHGNRAFEFYGGVDYLSGASPIDTSKNFTLTAWAKVNDGDRARGVVAVEDSAGLFYDAALKRWAFGMTEAADKTAPRVALSRDAAQVGVWTHLTGTYESVTRTLALHVDGIKQAEVAGVTGWQAAQLLVGGNRWGVQEYVGNRTIDEVKVYPRTLNDAEVGKVASAAGLRSHYKLNGTGGFTSDEVTGTYSSIGPGVGWEQDGDDTSLLFNGPDAEGQPRDGESFTSVRGPRIRTDRSFTVSAWARLDLDAHENQARTFVSLVHNGTSLLDLRYGGASKKWEFVVDGTTVATQYRAEMQEWTYLTAVHDKLNSEIRLYFNGVYVTKAPFTGGSAETEAGLELGRLSPATTAGSFWKGGVDDVRVHAGVLTEEQIIAQAVRV